MKHFIGWGLVILVVVGLVSLNDVLDTVTMEHLTVEKGSASFDAEGGTKTLQVKVYMPMRADWEYIDIPLSALEVKVYNVGFDGVTVSGEAEKLLFFGIGSQLDFGPWKNGTLYVPNEEVAEVWREAIFEEMNKGLPRPELVPPPGYKKVEQ